MPDVCNNQTQALEKIRPELNLEKWAIWQPAKSKNPPKRRTIKREITLPNGNKITAEVRIGFTDMGALTTEDQKTYYALVKLWENQGKPTEQASLSLRKLAKILRKKWGTNVIDSLTNSTLKLRVNPFFWENSYFDSSAGETLELLDTFNILSDLKIIKRKKDGVVNKEAGYFRFNDFILKNLLTNHTKPLFLDIVLNFKSEIAQILYTYLDLIMADKNHYERKTKELFEDLKLEGKAYEYLSDRKRKLEKALKELQRVDISTGTLTVAELQPTKDKKDYKVVFKKEPFKKHEVIETAAEPIPEPAGESPALTFKIEPEVDKLLNYFHGRLNHPNYQPISKEIDQATSLLARHGEEQTKYIINYALTEAPKTNFQMKTFGAVFQYQSEALKSYEEKRKQKEIAEARQAQAERKEQEKLQRARQEREELDALHQALTDTQKQKLTELVNQQKPSYISNDPTSPMTKAFYQNTQDRILKEFKANPEILTVAEPVGEREESTSLIGDISDDEIRDTAY